MGRLTASTHKPNGRGAPATRHAARATNPAADEPSPAGRRWGWPLAIFAIALTVRLWHLSQLRRSPFWTTLFGDARAYDEWAVRIAGGDWIGSDVFYQAPLYPYFLGVLYTLAGRDLLVVRVVQAVLGAAGSALLALAATRLMSRRAGIIAGLIPALYGPLVFADALIQKSVLDVFLVSAILWLLSGLVGAPAPHRGLPFGRALSLGLACAALLLSRENAAVFAAVILAALAMPHAGLPIQRRLALAAMFTAGLLGGLAPVGARNWTIGGSPVVTTAQFGPNFYIGNNPNADGTYMALREGRGDPAFERQDATALAEQAAGRALSPAEVSRFWRDRALAFFVEEPGRWLWLIGRKIVLLANDAELIDTEAQQSHADWSWPLTLAGAVGRFGVLLPIAAFGFIVAWPPGRPLGLVAALAAAYAASVVLFFVVARYRYPLIPLLAVCAAAGLSRAASLARATPRRRLAAAAIPAALALAAQWPTLSGAEMRAITEVNLGAARQAAREYEAAVGHYRRAIDHDPAFAAAYNNLGVALRELGRPAEAAAAYREALSRRHDLVEAEFNLGTVLLEQGQASAALDHLQRGRAAMPDTAVAHHNLGRALGAANRLGEAIAEFERARALAPDSAIVLRSLSQALVARGRPDDAIRPLRRLAMLEPGRADTRFELASALLAGNRPAEAEAAFREALGLAPERAESHLGLGVALAAQARFDAAIAAFERALTLRPESADARRYLEMARQERARQVR